MGRNVTSNSRANIARYFSNISVSSGEREGRIRDRTDFVERRRVDIFDRIEQLGSILAIEMRSRNESEIRGLN